jgi:hypothetical protein
MVVMFCLAVLWLGTDVRHLAGTNRIRNGVCEFLQGKDGA